MRVHIISDVYPPEPVTAANTARDIACEMAQRGHEVTVFAPFPNRPRGILFSRCQRSWKKTEHREGYKIVYSWHTLSRRSTMISRMAENISFGLTSTIQLLKEPKPDVVYMNTWPIFAQWLNTFLLHHYKVPIITVVHDLYPETISDTRHIAPNNPIVRFLRRIDNQVYHRSTVVTALNPVQKDYLFLNRGVTFNKLRVLNDWVDPLMFLRDLPHNNGFRKDNGISHDSFLAMYVGSMTRMAGLNLYIQTADILRHRKDIKLLLVGDGGMRHEIEMTIQKKALDNLKVIYPLNPETVPEVQGAADVLMLSLLPGAGEHTTPSKLIYYMFSQRPIIASVNPNGPPARIIGDAQCGFVIPQGSPEDLAATLIKMADNRESLFRLGENARSYAEDHFMKSKALPRVCNLIEEVGSSQQGSLPSTPKDEVPSSLLESNL